MVVLRALGTVELTDDTGRELAPILRQPKRLALLVYLALAAPPGFHWRDALLALLWPELDQEHARAALRKALFALRRALGEAAIVGRGDDEVRIAADVVWCDAVALGRALDAGELAEALALYRGDLLPGFHVADASPDLSHWLETERARLRGVAAAGAWRLAEQGEQQGEVVGAREWAYRAAHLAPFDEHAARRLMATLDRLRDKVAGIRAYEAFARRLREELELEPSEETRALARALRDRTPRIPDGGPRPRVARAENRAAVAAGAVTPSHDLSQATGDALPPARAARRKVLAWVQQTVPLWRWHRATPLGIAIGLILAVGAVRWQGRGSDDQTLANAGELVRSAASPAGAPPYSIAVLPFVTLGPDSAAYLGESIAEELISALPVAPEVRARRR